MKETINLENATIDEIVNEIDKRINKLSLAKSKIMNALNSNQYRQFTNFSVRINESLYKEFKKYCDKNKVTISSLLKSYISQAVNSMNGYYGEFFEVAKQHCQSSSTRTIAIALDDNTAQHFKFVMNANNITLQKYIMSFIGHALSSKFSRIDYFKTNKYDIVPFKAILKDKIGEKQYIDVVTTDSCFKILSHINNLYEQIYQYIFDVGNDSSGGVIKKADKHKTSNFQNSNELLCKTISLAINYSDWVHFVFMCKNYHIVPSKCLINWFINQVEDK